MANQNTVTENDLLDYILQTLFYHLDINEMHLEKDILAKTNVPLNDKQAEHIRELLMTTNMVNNSVGFGKSGYAYLNKYGITMMKKYKTYHNILAAEYNQFPVQFSSQHVIQPSKGEEEKDDNKDTQNASSGEAGYDDMAH